MINLDLLFNLVGLIGGILGIMSWISSRRRESRIAQEQNEMWQMYVVLIQAFKERGGNVWEPKVGSKEHKLAERMVEKGYLKRAPMGGYCLPFTILNP